MSVSKIWFQCPSCLRCCYNICIGGIWRCELCFPPIASDRESVASPAEDARQSATESLPAQPEQVRLCPHGFDVGCFVCNFKPVASLPVEDKEKEQPCAHYGVSGQINGKKQCSICYDSDPKPTQIAEAKEKCDLCGQPKNDGWNHARESGYVDFATVSCSAPVVAEAKPSPDLDAAFEELLREPSWKEMKVCNNRQRELNAPAGADISAVNAQKKAIGEMLAARLAAWNAAIKKAETR